MLKIITLISAIYIALFLFWGAFASEHLNKHGFIRMMRIGSRLAIAAFIIFTAATIIKNAYFLNAPFYHNLTFNKILGKLLWSWLPIFLCLIVCWEWRYYIKHDEKTILASWYIKKRFALSKKQKYNEAYQCMQKACEIMPDSVFIWCDMAYCNEIVFKNPDQCDQYLAKAKQVLDSSASPSSKDQAILECFTGYVLQHRGHFQEGFERMKKAYELDPTPFRKKTCESALKIVQESTIESLD